MAQLLFVYHYKFADLPHSFYYPIEAQIDTVRIRYDNLLMSETIFKIEVDFRIAWLSPFVYITLVYGRNQLLHPSKGNFPVFQLTSFITFEFSVYMMEITTIKLPHNNIMFEIVRFSTRANETNA